MITRRRLREEKASVLEVSIGAEMVSLQGVALAEALDAGQ